MSRIGKKPVTLPKGVTLELQGRVVAVKGPRGRAAPRACHPEMADRVRRRAVFTVARPSEDKRHKALHGLTRTLVQNMVDGVSKGFAKTLEIQGVGYKAEAKPYGVNLIVGLLAPGQVRGAQGDQDLGREQHDGQDRRRRQGAVGQVAAELRSVRPPEPYKGKGIRYHR